jgi:peptidoglycan/xylan/chitin deacetylase (PgdA/CDA1 family)
MSRTIPILMYHALTPARTPAFARWTITSERFEGHLDYLHRSGYHAVTVGELTAIRSGQIPEPGHRLVALTFDDAYVDFHTTALPLLAKYRMTATLFVPAGYVGGYSEWMHLEGEANRPLLSWAALVEIAGCGIEIGSHSHTHPELDRLSAEGLAAETIRPKALLEDKIGKPVNSFAYPFGRFNRPARDAVAVAGYSAGCTMLAWSATYRDHPLELPRVSIYQDTDTDSLAQRLAAHRNPLRRQLLRGERVLRKFQQTYARHETIDPERGRHVEQA